MRRPLLLATLGVLAAACTIVNGLTTTNDPVPDAGSSDGAAVDGGPHDGAVLCVPHHPPAPPTSGDDGDDVTFVSAVRSLDFGVGDSGATTVLGFDLDNACSPFGTSTCQLPASSTAEGDGDGGVDNATTSLVRGGRPFGVDVADDFAAALRRGRSGFLVWVQDYNGGAEDPLVRVGLLVGNGNVAGTKITFAPDERWNVLPEQSAVDNLSRIIPSTFVPGYVTGKQLVVPDGAFLLPLLGSHPMQVTKGILTANIVSVDGGFALSDGQLAGRGAVADLLRAFGGVALPDGGGHLCDSPTSIAKQQLTVLTGYVCSARDIGDGTDGGGGGPCSAVSFGVGFQAVPTSIGGQKALDDDPCGDAGLRCE